MADAIRVMLVDDHAVVREGLWAMLETKPGIEVIGEAADGEEAVERARLLKPDVILMDIIMPKKDGVRAIREIRELQPDSRILVLSSAADDILVAESLRAGAMGYLLKTAMPSELVDAIKHVHAGETPLDPAVARKLVNKLTDPLPSVPLKEILTDREMEILLLVARGLSNNEIAKNLGISVRTVGTHTSHILAKVGVENRTQLALVALRQGLVSLYPA
ncbi:MAG: response regulator transcription factor [Chloroflexota bacterium]